MRYTLVTEKFSPLVHVRILCAHLRLKCREPGGFRFDASTTEAGGATPGSSRVGLRTAAVRLVVKISLPRERV